MSEEPVPVEASFAANRSLWEAWTTVHAEGDYYDLEVQVGRSSTDVSTATFEVAMAEEAALEALLEELHVHGVNRMESGDAELVAADRDGVLPEGFYSTTNLATSVRVTGHWLEVENPEMDCALVVDHFGIARTAPMHQIRHGQLVVVGPEKDAAVAGKLRKRGATMRGYVESFDTRVTAKAGEVTTALDQRLSTLDLAWTTSSS